MDRATMSLQCWVIVLVGLMSYFNPERALGAPQKEGERCRLDGMMLLMRSRGEEAMRRYVNNGNLTV